MLRHQAVVPVVDFVGHDTLPRLHLEGIVGQREFHLESSFSLLVQRSGPHVVVRAQILLPVAGRTPLHREASLENQGMAAERPHQRQVGPQRQVSASVSRRVEPHVRIPVDIPFDFAAHRAVGEKTGLLDRRVLAREEILRVKLRIGVQVESHTSVDGSHHAVAVPRLRLHEEAVRYHALVGRVARLGGIEVPVVVVVTLGRNPLPGIRVPRTAFVGIGCPDVGIDLAPRVVLEGVPDVDGRKSGYRVVLFGDPLERDAVRLRDEEGVVAVEVLRLCIRQLHRNARRHLERGVGNGPFANHAAVLLLLDVVVDVTGMHRVAFARMVERQG